MSGSNNLIFNNMDRAKWNKDEPLRLSLTIGVII